MAYEIVKFDDDSGQSITITPQDVKQTFCPSATDQEVQLFLALCVTKRLNPFTREAYLVKYGNAPAQMITARAAFQKRADANPDFEGTEIGTVVLCPDGTIQHNNGEAYYPMAGQRLIGGWARVYRKGRKPYYAEVSLQEYNTGKSSWNKMPATMIAKVAEVHALRNAFPTEFSGMYVAEEMDEEGIDATADAAMGQEPVAEATYEVPQEQPSQDDVKAELRSILEVWVKNGYDRKSTADWMWQKYQMDGMEALRIATANIVPAMQNASGEPELYDEEVEF